MRLFIFYILISSGLFAQVEARRPISMYNAPEFFVDALSFSTGDSLSSRVDVYVQIPYDLLQFVKMNDQYVSKYEITLNFLNDKNSSVSEKIWTEEVKVPMFEYTGSKKAFSLTQRSAEISPGLYSLKVQLRDNESGKVSSVVKKINVDHYFKSSLALSDVMLVSRIAADGERRKIVPNISGNIGENNNAFSIFFEVYSSNPADSLEFRYVITDIKGKQLLNKSQPFKMHGVRGQMITRFDSSQYSTGAYSVNVEVRSVNASVDEPFLIKERPFVVRWGDLPISISDLDLAIRQMRYIAKDAEYDKISEAKTDEEKRKLFDEFWKKRDPNVSTVRNEYMEEYYSRVEYANKHFSHYQPGWKTDMGMVFILFGSPSNVERHPFDVDTKPYEIWSYYDYNRSIVFVDETGFGDYRLLTPIWDLIQRLKIY